VIEVHPRLFVGSQDDYERRVRHEQGWCVVHACKDPYHREALGYSGRAAAKTHPEYLIVRRGDRLILNLVDAADPAYIPEEIMDAALSFIEASLHADRPVLVHCNQGHSRAPSIALLYLRAHTARFASTEFESAEHGFREIYPAYRPAAGVQGFLRSHWAVYDRNVSGVEPGSPVQ
jgi:hypothetical protein